jgi:hypothetical protein
MGADCRPAPRFVLGDTTGRIRRGMQLIAVRIALDDTENLDVVPG